MNRFHHNETDIGDPPSHCVNVSIHYPVFFRIVQSYSIFRHDLTLDAQALSRDEIALPCPNVGASRSSALVTVLLHLAPRLSYL